MKRFGLWCLAASLAAAACSPTTPVPTTETPVADTPTTAPTLAPATETPAASAEATVTVDEAGVATFTAPELGIQFTYLSALEGTTFEAQLTGDKVYVYPEGSEATQGQFVQVFSKSPDQTLEEAITAQLLEGYEPADCLITPAMSLNPQAPATYSYVTLDVPREAEDTLPDLTAKAEKCPPYLNLGGLAFFAADSAHPDKFAFFSIGQYVIPSAGETPWQNTFAFIS